MIRGFSVTTEKVLDVGPVEVNKKENRVDRLADLRGRYFHCSMVGVVLLISENKTDRKRG